MSQSLAYNKQIDTLQYTTEHYTKFERNPKDISSTTNVYKRLHYNTIQNWHIACKDEYIKYKFARIVPFCTQKWQGLIIPIGRNCMQEWLIAS